MSPRTAFLGKLLGLYLIAVSLSMFAHPQASLEIIKEIIQDPPLLFIAGLMGVTAGLAIVLAHNVWSGGALPIIVTLFGWASLTKGMILLTLSPEMESRISFLGFATSGIRISTLPLRFFSALTWPMRGSVPQRAPHNKINRIKKIEDLRNSSARTPPFDEAGARSLNTELNFVVLS